MAIHFSFGPLFCYKEVFENLPIFVQLITKLIIDESGVSNNLLNEFHD
jgi:hypothetical protein